MPHRHFGVSVAPHDWQRSSRGGASRFGLCTDVTVAICGCAGGSAAGAPGTSFTAVQQSGLTSIIAAPGCRGSPGANATCGCIMMTLL